MANNDARSLEIQPPGTLRKAAPWMDAAHGSSLFKVFQLLGELLPWRISRLWMQTTTVSAQADPYDFSGTYLPLSRRTQQSKNSSLFRRIFLNGGFWHYYAMFLEGITIPAWFPWHCAKLSMFSVSSISSR